MAGRARLAIAILLLAALPACRRVASFLSEPGLVRALPAAATDVRTWSWQEQGPLPQDSTLRVRARVTHEEFVEYVTGMGMAPHTPERRYGHGFAPAWGPDPGIDWWTPSRELGETYVREDGASWTSAKWEDGFIWIAHDEI